MGANFIGPIDLRSELKTKPLREREKPQDSQKPDPVSTNPDLEGLRRTDQKGGVPGIEKVIIWREKLTTKQGVKKRDTGQQKSSLLPVLVTQRRDLRVCTCQMSG